MIEVEILYRQPELGDGMKTLARRRLEIRRIESDGDDYAAVHTYEVKMSGGSRNHVAQFEHRYGDPLADILAEAAEALRTVNADPPIFDTLNEDHRQTLLEGRLAEGFTKLDEVLTEQTATGSNLYKWYTRAMSLARALSEHRAVTYPAQMLVLQSLWNMAYKEGRDHGERAKRFRPPGQAQPTLSNIGEQLHVDHEPPRPARFNVLDASEGKDPWS